MRVLSFKIAMIVFSNIPLEEKYRCTLFFWLPVPWNRFLISRSFQISFPGRSCDPKTNCIAFIWSYPRKCFIDLFLGNNSFWFLKKIDFWWIIDFFDSQIPRLVGESAAFGGTNVEPSVRSCFETVRLAPTISEGAFIDWVKKVIFSKVFPFKFLFFRNLNQ